MSLIEEALRRVQDPLLPTVQSPPKPSAAPAPGQPTAQPAQPTAHSWPTAVASPAASARPAASTATTTNALMIVAIAVLALTIALIAGGIFWFGSRTHEGQTAERSDSVGPAGTEQPIVQRGAPAPSETRAAAPAPSASSAAGLVLNGVVLGAGGPPPGVHRRKRKPTP